MMTSTFIATPISAFGSDAELQSFRDWLVKLIDSVRNSIPELDVESEVLGIQSSEDYDDPSASVIKDLEAIDRTECFILVYPKPTASSALIELGYALAKNKPVLILARSIDDLPSIVKSRYDEGEGVCLLILDNLNKVTDGILSFLSGR